MKNTMLIAIAALGVVLAGCSQEAQEKAGEAAGQTVDAAGKVGDAVATDAKKAGDAVVEGAAAAGNAAVEGAAAVGNAVVEGTAEVTEALSGAAITGRVKTALAAEKDINAGDLNVDTLDDKKEVVLRGSVQDEAAKNKASTIAAGVVPKGYKVVNQLTTGKK